MRSLAELQGSVKTYCGLPVMHRIHQASHGWELEPTGIDNAELPRLPLDVHARLSAATHEAVMKRDLLNERLLRKQPSV